MGGHGSERVVLAYEPSVILGRLTAFPSSRELVRDDGTRLVLEHRVMRVLIALAKAHAAFVPRDELTQRCRDGRVVGDSWYMLRPPF
jgi:DNA-binding winged helix-turn-helix (wHTH) protein